MEKISGIYKIENIINKKLYIGSSYDIKQRWRNHKTDLKNNKHHNKHLQYAINKYKLENFNFEIIKECSTECSIENLLEQEQYYINLYKNKNILYNANLIVTGSNRKELILKICKQCKIYFKVQPCNINRIFCSKKCSDESFKHNIVGNCKNCDKEIKLIKYDLKRGYDIFCSNQCKYAYKRKNPSGVFVKCKFCDTLFKTKKSRLKNNRGKFCSKKCANESYKKIKIE